jgi:hypothetical protein
MIPGKWLALGVVLSCGACAAHVSEQAQDGPDLGDETSTSDALSLGKLTPLAFNTHAVAAFGKMQWFGYRLHGSAGQKISVFADAATYPTVVNTIVYLYKVSSAGHVYGKPLASNDDDAHNTWSRSKYSSSIHGFVLPETRDYAIVVTSYKQASTGNAAVWWTTSSSTPTPTTPVKVSLFTLQFTGRFDATTGTSRLQSIELHRDGTYRAGFSTGGTESGTYTALTDKAIPLKLQFKTGTTTFTGAVTGYDDKLVIGSTTLQLRRPIVADEGLCDDTKGIWRDDESNSEGLYCDCSDGTYFIPSEGGCVK